MRVLFTSFGASTHLALLLPLAHQFANDGHQVRIATHENERNFLTGAGLPFTILASAPEFDLLLKLEDTFDIADDSGRVDLGAPRERSKKSRAVVDHTDTAGLIAGKLNGYGMLVCEFMTNRRFTAKLIEFARNWKPDIVVWDALSYAGSITSRVVGATSVRSLFALDQISALREQYVDLGRIGDPFSSSLFAQVQQMGGSVDRTEEDLKGLLYGDITLNPLPDQTQPAVRHTRIDIALPAFFGGEVPDSEWLRQSDSGRPRVCVTIGISSRQLRLKLPPLGQLLDALEMLSVDVIVTIGLEEAKRHGFFRAGFTYAEGRSLEALLPNVDLLIHHFGTGTLLSGIRHGVPQMHFEAPTDYWGERELSESLHASGHVRTVYFDNASVESIKSTVEAMLADPQARVCAMAARDAYRTRPPLADAVEQIVQYATHRQTVESEDSSRAALVDAG